MIKYTVVSNLVIRRNCSVRSNEITSKYRHIKTIVEIKLNKHPKLNTIANYIHKYENTYYDIKYLKNTKLMTFNII